MVPASRADNFRPNKWLKRDARFGAGAHVRCRTAGRRYTQSFYPICRSYFPFHDPQKLQYLTQDSQGTSASHRAQQADLLPKYWHWLKFLPGDEMHSGHHALSDPILRAHHFGHVYIRFSMPGANLLPAIQSTSGIPPKSESLMLSPSPIMMPGFVSNTRRTPGFSLRPVNSLNIDTCQPSPLHRLHTTAAPSRSLVPV